MRKMMLLAVLAAIAALMLAATPAMADDFDRHDFCRFFDCNNNNDNFCDDDFFFDNCRFDRFDRFNNGFGDFEQDADSGDIDQSFDVTGGGDNSNQTVGTQGVANTGNAQNQIGVTDFGDFDNFNGNDFCDNFHRNNFCDNRFDRFDNFGRFNNGFGDFEFEDSGASIEVSPINTTSSDQEVNQAASASG